METIDYDFVIFSLPTVRQYIKKYDVQPWSVDVAPEHIFSHLGLGTLLNDEAHQSFHSVYMTLLRLNPLRVLSLSATLDNLDKDLRKMYFTLYPKSARCSSLAEFKPYPIVIAVKNRVPNGRRINCVTDRGYSHIKFEQGMMRNHRYKSDYIYMICNYIDKGYLDRRVSGDKCLILVSTIKFATMLSNYLKQKYAELSVDRYVEDDPYENIMNADITVSTNLSAGTALDIPRLITVIQTVPMRSLQANVQALGRLRELKDQEVRYYYFYSNEVGSQYKLHLARVETTRHLAKEYRYETYDKDLVY